MAGPRILIVRLSAFGDCVLTLPMLCALRRTHPDATICWLTQSNCAPILRGHPCLDEVIETSRTYLYSLPETNRLRNELRKRSFDITIDPQGLLKSAFAAWLSGAPQRIGFANPLGREGSCWLNNTRIRPTHSHIIDHHRELLTPLGVVPGEVEFRTPVDHAAERKIAAWLRDCGLDKFCVFNPGAAWPSKCWPLERYAAAARQVRDATGTPTVISWGGAKEERWADEVVERAGGGAIKAPPTDLRELASLLRKASLFVGSDTGPLHLAESVGAPCVGIYGPTRPENSGPYGPRHILLQKMYQGGSSKQRRNATNEAISMIQVDELVSACKTLLSREQRTAA